MRQAEEIAQEIWALAIQEISCACPFFVLACSYLKTGADEKCICPCTDGRVIHYSPAAVLSDFQEKGRKYINRMYLHSLFHCLYLHPADREKREETLWNLACDMVAEYTVDCLGVPFLLGEPGREKEEVYRMFWNEKESRTAAEIYGMLLDGKFEKGCTDAWSRLFFMDGHSLWRDISGGELAGIREIWEKAAAYTSRDAGSAGKRAGSEKGNMQEWYELQQKRRYDYRKFLRRFAVQREEVQLDMESFDYISYCLGLSMYGNMPLVEPLEYTEAFKLEEIVIAIDTSSSCSRQTVQRFLEETYSMLSERENFFKKMNVHIIQCDCYIQEDVILSCEEDWRAYMKQIRIQGRGGTDFRPVFTYVEKLIEKKKIRNLKGLLYFTDGDGIYPPKKPDYETAFIFIKEPPENVKIPSWAIRLYLDERKAGS
ncbi:VWA-like domain-containing protein [Blautia marasmi]|uniref:vWA domain-containing protein n=1 Tax=Blautia marasmi TaxID=1917868 RepID=UPI00266D5BCA|nr:VWA-like domain-containing protein [Blautia marasmi]